MSDRPVFFILGTLLGGVVVFLLTGGNGWRSEAGLALGAGGEMEARLRSLEGQIAHLSEQLAGAAGPTLLGSRPQQPGPEDGEEVTSPPTGIERVALAIAALRPEDYREPFPPLSQRAAWTSLGAVQRKLRSEDAIEWVAWVSEHATDKLAGQLADLATPIDRQWLHDVFLAFFDEQMDSFLRARAVWEDRSLPGLDRSQAYQEWLRTMYAAVEARDTKIQKHLDQNHPGWRQTRVIFPP